MDNKYKAFTKAMESIDSVTRRNACNSLIDIAQEYVSNLIWYNQLKKVDDVLIKYEDGNKDKISILDNFILLGCYEYVKCDVNLSFKDFIRDYIFNSDYLKKDRNDGKIKLKLFDDYPALDNVQYSPYIKQAFIKYKKLHKIEDFSTQYISIRHINLEKAVNIYINHSKVEYIDKETAFNLIFSENYVNNLIEGIQKNKPVVELNLISPVRILLFEGTLHNNSLTDYINMEIGYNILEPELEDKITYMPLTKNLNELKQSCNETIDKYYKDINNIKVMNKWFLKLENKL